MAPPLPIPVRSPSLLASAAAASTPSSSATPGSLPGNPTTAAPPTPTPLKPTTPAPSIFPNSLPPRPGVTRMGTTAGGGVTAQKYEYFGREAKSYTGAYALLATLLTLSSIMTAVAIIRANQAIHTGALEECFDRLLATWPFNVWLLTAVVVGGFTVVLVGHWCWLVPRRGRGAR